MKNLRKLREACNYTQEELAKMLDTTQQTVARWEAGKAEPNLAALRDMAVIFGTSVDDLMGVNPFSKSVATTIFASLDGGYGHFWGHLGVQLPGPSSTRWYPISAEVADLASRCLAGAGEDHPWLMIPTLNNRLLWLNVDFVKSISLRGDSASQDPDDWELGWDGEGGYPLEVYRALAHSVIGGAEEASERFRQAVEDVIKEERLTPELIMARVVVTTIHFNDGTSKHVLPDERNLWSLVAEMEVEPPKILDLSNEEEDVDMYVPSASLAMVDAPLCLVLDAARSQRAEYEAEEAKSTDTRLKSIDPATTRRSRSVESGSGKRRAT